MNYIYLDHSATTYTKQEVLHEMLPYFNYIFGNASANYILGQESKNAIKKARMQVAKAICALPEEIFFTSGGSEADNLIIKGYARANKETGNHIITTKIEHKAVLNACRMLEKEGFKITYLNVDNDGLIDLNELENSINSNTILISVMFANNEIGTIEPIKQISEIAHKHNILFHTDAVQAVGNIPISVQELGIDALSLSAHKFYGPKGAGALYVRKGFEFEPIINGGQQEQGKRAGTENVPGIVGLGKAIEIANKNIEQYNKKLLQLREYYIRSISNKISNIRVNGHKTNRLPGNVNITFDGVEASSLLPLLSSKGIFASGGSACNSASVNPSHVLMAIGLSEQEARSTVRMTFGEDNAIEQVNYVVKVLEDLIPRLRK